MTVKHKVTYSDVTWCSYWKTVSWTFVLENSSFNFDCTNVKLIACWWSKYKIPALIIFSYRTSQRLLTNVHQLISLADLLPTPVPKLRKPSCWKFSFFYLCTRGTWEIWVSRWTWISAMLWANFSDNNTEQFWITTTNHLDASGYYDFLQLGHFSLHVLTLPFSDAAVERTFSQVNLIKTKIRNRLGRAW